MTKFETIQRQYALLGISSSPHQSNQKLSFNKKVTFGFLLFGYTFSSQFVYIFLVSNGFIEHLQCICSILAGFLVFTCFLSVVFRKTTIFEIIDNIKTIIDTSESPILNSVYFDWIYKKLKLINILRRREIPKIKGILH